MKITYLLIFISLLSTEIISLVVARSGTDFSILLFNLTLPSFINISAFLLEQIPASAISFDTLKVFFTF